MRKFTPAALRATRAGKGLLTVMALAAVGSAGVLGTNAAFNDNVTMAQITVTGGSLDLVANADTGDSAVAWNGTITADVSNMAPGDVGTGTVRLDNVGSLPYTLTVTTDGGGDVTNCFGVWFRETGVFAGTGAGAHPVNFAGLGTGAGDLTTAALTGDVSDIDLPDAGADLEWETDDAKDYTLTILMKSDCITNSATGTLDVSFDATQV